MAGADREAVETFISITGASEEVAIRKLEDFHGDLNQAVNAYFTEGDRNNIRTAPTVIPENDSMDIDEPFLTETRGNPFPFLSSARNTSPFALLDPDFGRGLFDGGTAFTSREPFVSHPREVREIPIEVIDGHGNSSRSGHAPSIEEITGSAQEHGPEIHGPIVIDEEDDEVIQRSLPAPSAPVIGDFPDYTNDIEEEMIRAAIEASKKDAREVHLGPNFDFGNDSGRQTQQRQPSAEDAQLAHAVSLSLKAVEQERAVHELGIFLERLKIRMRKKIFRTPRRWNVVLPSSKEDPGLKKIKFFLLSLCSFLKEGIDFYITWKSGLAVGSSSFQDEAEDVEEHPLVRHRLTRNSGGAEVSASSSVEQHTGPDTAQNRNGFNFDEFVQNSLGTNQGLYPQRSPSPGLAAQRMIREQQDDEYLASLQADREKELKAVEEAEVMRLEEQAVKEAAAEAERRKEEELRKKFEEEQEIERNLAAKEASLPKEPMADDENAVTLLVRMPDGSRRGRRFVKSDKLQSLFDFIDVGRVVKPDSYRLVEVSSSIFTKST
ncbi:plant UBX domain-containing protein 8-like [Impatiens glandulifera]|uniref:plant UBX domain-containing protein 8-like n=1 Tax=Impatiens glandulifera TaxID=253017 RepID=UPI001FB0816C|nr:plant UBX domain-containing protein 8-like [Impatiens glandulifera]